MHVDISHSKFLIGLKGIHVYKKIKKKINKNINKNLNKKYVPNFGVINVPI